MSRLRARGFSLIELMVSIVIGMVALVFATRMLANSNHTGQGAGAGADSMQNGIQALFSLSTDANQAGWGINDSLVNGCDTVFSDTSGYTLTGALRGTTAITPLTPVLIEDNGSAPDRITFYAGSSMSGTGTVGIAKNYAAGASIDIDRVPYGFNVGDVVLAAPDTPGTSCALAQVTSVAPVLGQQTIAIASGGSNRFNSGNLGASFTGSQSRLFNLGPAASLAFHTWSVNGGYLQLRATNLSGASAAATTVLDNVVSIKAEYGFDLTAASAFNPSAGVQVSQWSTSMVDADGDGVVGSMGDFQHVTAVRLAVIARSRAPDKPGTGGTCTTTTAPLTVFASARPANAAVPLTPSLAVAGDTVSWTCYRYRVFENIVPLRNAAWRP
jgi:type IV pilus assembly protein PilW